MLLPLRAETGGVELLPRGVTALVRDKLAVNNGATALCGPSGRDRIQGNEIGAARGGGRPPSQMNIMTFLFIVKTGFYLTTR